MKKKTSESCCAPAPVNPEYYRVESMVSVDDRGQMVLPKEVRERLNIKSGDKMALVVLERAGVPCCITLIKADELSSMVQNMLGPVNNPKSAV